MVQSQFYSFLFIISRIKEEIQLHYPDELVQEAKTRMQNRPVEGFVAGQGPLFPKLMLVGEAPEKQKSKTIFLLADKLAKN